MSAKNRTILFIILVPLGIVAYDIYTAWNGGFASTISDVLRDWGNKLWLVPILFCFLMAGVAGHIWGQPFGKSSRGWYILIASILGFWLGYLLFGKP